MSRLLADWICRSKCGIGSSWDLGVTVYERGVSGVDHDFEEWWCNEAHRNVRTDEPPPEECPFRLEHVVSQ